MFQARRKKDAGKGIGKQPNDRKGKKRAYRCMNELMDLDDDKDEEDETQKDNNSHVQEKKASTALFRYRNNSPEDRREHNSSPYIHVKTEEV